MPGLKVVALISGGKDSLFSILHCTANGHEVVALANLYPASQDGAETAEDTDSFMYQTIGHAIIPLYEEALGLPLYRQEIQGSALNSSKDYGPEEKVIDGGSSEDETESLVPLLEKVLAAHPEVNAVSTGAILSDYQRTRVESVALRLGLAPVSYLWQFPKLPPGTQDSLLRSMSAAGQDSRIIKVASGGLDESFLWRNVADARTIHRLGQATQRFGSTGDGAVLGEGGEFETLAIDGPSPLWKRRIVVEDGGWQAINGDAGTAFARISKAECVGKDTTGSPPTVRRPSLLDVGFSTLFEKSKSNDGLDGAANNISPSQATACKQRQTEGTMRNEDVFLVPNITGSGSTAAEQTESIMTQISGQLSRRNRRADDICYTSIILRNMGDFTAVNPVYGRYFTAPNPPARVTIACADVLPEGCLLSISITSIRRPPGGQRPGLHVQSRSYWAPANIGPYSQAIATPLTDGATNAASSLVYIAGQIPLIPGSMELPTSQEFGNQYDSFRCQGVLALQHLARIGVAMRVQVWLHVIAFITASSQDEAQSRASQVRSLWTTYNTPHDAESDEDDPEGDFDVWDMKHGMQSHGHSGSMPEGRLQPASSAANCTLSVALVDELPRGASIEWASYGCTAKVDAGEVHIPHFEALRKAFAQRLVV